MQNMHEIGAQEMFRNLRKLGKDKNIGVQNVQAKPGCCRFPKNLKSVNMVGDPIDKVQMFCCLGDLLCTDNEVQEAVTAKIKAGWKKFKDVADQLCMKDVYKIEGVVYNIFVYT